MPISKNVVKNYIRYATTFLFVQMCCECVSYSCQVAYYGLCCSNFKTFLLMKSSNTCIVLRNAEYINPSRILTSYADFTR